MDWAGAVSGPGEGQRGKRGKRRRGKVRKKTYNRIKGNKKQESKRAKKKKKAIKKGRRNARKEKKKREGEKWQSSTASAELCGKRMRHNGLFNIIKYWF